MDMDQFLELDDDTASRFLRTLDEKELWTVAIANLRVQQSAQEGEERKPVEEG